jgi:hypothetical protein
LSQLLLIHTEFSRTTESDSSFSSGFSPRTCSLSYQISLKFRYTGKDSHNHFSSVSRRISPGFRERLKPPTSLTNCFHRFQEVASGAREAVEFPDRDRIASSNLIEHPPKLRLLAIAARDLFAKDLLATGFFQRSKL